MGKGIIYLMSTVVDGLIKIGCTNKFEERMHQLESNGYQNVVGLKREFAIQVDEYQEKEKLLHDVFEKSRVGKSELFSVDINLAKKLLSSFKGEKIFPENESLEEIFENATEELNSKNVPNGDYYLESNVRINDKTEFVKAIMRVKDGKFIILKGSSLSSIFTNKTKKYIEMRKKSRIENNILQEDLICSSVSMAACIVTGKSKNGWLKWKDKSGRNLDYYRKEND